MNSERFRAAALAGCGVVLWLGLPLLLLLRLVLRTPSWFGKVSVWTGAPIITLPLKCEAERLLGWNAKSVVRDTYHLTSSFDFVLSRHGRSPLAQLVLAHLGVFFVAVFAKQVHSFLDGGLLPSMHRRCYNPFELYLYRILGIRQFFWTYGGDVRTRAKTLALGKYNACLECPAVMKACVCSQSVLDQNLQRIQASATAIFTMGDMVEYVPGSVTNLFYWPIAMPVEISAQALRPEELFTPDRPMRIVHAANHRFFKGTQHLVDAVDSLKKQGLPIELTLVEGLDNQSAMKIYGTADAIFDQCLIGFHGYFALEAMALGKPVLCYIRDPARYLLEPNQCPIINTRPDSLASDLARLFQKGPTELQQLGEQGRQYVRQHYSVKAFAARLDSFYSTLKQTT